MSVLEILAKILFAVDAGDLSVLVLFNLSPDFVTIQPRNFVAERQTTFGVRPQDSAFTRPTKYSMYTKAYQVWQ